MEGISSSAGNACWYLSTVGRIFSAIFAEVSLCVHKTMMEVTYVLVDEQDGDVLAFGVLLESSFDGGDLCLLK